jgi:hypothetical protein
MSRIPSAIVAVLLLAPMICTICSSSDDSRDTPSLGAHQGSLYVGDFSAMESENISLRQDGGAELGHAASYWSNGFKVSDAAGVQGEPVMTSNSRGEFIVTWQDDRTTPKGIYFQRVDINGSKLGGEVAVATGAGHKGENGVCVDGKDNILVTWWDWRSGVDYKVYIKRYDSYGNLQGSEIRVSWGSGNQSQQSISADNEGNFVVAWSDDRAGFDNHDIYAQRYDYRGNRIGNEILMCNAQHDQWVPKVLMFPDGSFFLAWGDGRTGSSYDLFMQKYDINGEKVGSELTVAAGVGDEFPLKMLFDSKGDIVLSWREYIYPSGSDLFIQRFDSNGTKIGKQIKVNDMRKSYYPPFIALDSLDNIMCAFGESEFMEYWLYSQFFDANGDKVGGTAEIVHDSGNLMWMDIASDAKDNFLLTYGNGSGDLSGLPYLQPHHQNGALIIGPLSPQDLWRWSNLSAKTRSASPPAQSIEFDLSTDSGASWAAVAANGSLAPAGPAPSLYLRARLSTNDNSTTPVLYNITVRFMTNRLPVVTAGPDTSAPKNRQVDLMCNGSDPDGDALSYLWNQTGGPPAQLSGANSSKCSFNPNRSGIYSFKVTVNDGFNDSSPALVNISVSNSPPSVSAGPDILVQKGEMAVLTATGDDPDGDELEFIWNQTSGARRYIEKSIGREISFNAAVAGAFIFKVTASDGEATGPPDIVNLTVWGRAPVAALNVPDATAEVEEEVLFNASGSSDPDGNITGYNFHYGDGSESGWIQDSSAVHSYSSAGRFSTNVTVRDDDGNESASPAVTINVVVRSNPTVIITSPREGDALSSRNIQMTFSVQNFTVMTGAGHLHFKLDDEPEVPWYSTARYELANLSAGSHTLWAFLEDANHTRLTGAGSSASVRFSIIYQGLPDLAVTSSDLSVTPSKATEGQTITVSIRIYNIGQSDSAQFKVRFLIDGKAQPDQTVLLLGKGATVERHMTWKAQKGSHELKVIIDSDSQINESDESNNEANLSLSVTAAESGGTQIGLGWMLLVIIIIIVAAATGAVLLLRRKKGPANALPGQVPGPARPPMAGPPVSPPQTMPPPISQAALPPPPQTMPIAHPEAIPPPMPPSSMISQPPTPVAPPPPPAPPAPANQPLPPPSSNPLPPPSPVNPPPPPPPEQ